MADYYVADVRSISNFLEVDSMCDSTDVESILDMPDQTPKSKK